MKTIYKYNAQIDDSININMPIDSEILCVQIDNKDKEPKIWALVDTEKPNEERCFELFGTGNPIQEDMGIIRKYIGTYQYESLVFHLFERLN